MAANDGKPTIVIRKEEVVEGGHHGGAWKVAYADFVTAMMAFFLLMWLLNATTEEQRRGIADYFSPHNDISNSTSGFGLPFGGRTPNSVGSLASDRGAVQILPATHPLDHTDEEDDPAENPGTAAPKPPAAAGKPGETAGGGAPGLTPQDGLAREAPPQTPNTLPGLRARADGTEAVSAPTDADIQKEVERRERAAFERAAQQIRDTVRNDPALADLARQLVIEVTPEGLRVQLIDEDRQPMFATGSTAPNDRARALMAKIAPVLMKLPEQINITGHTDATPFKGGDRTNWDLSADRANATRRLLLEAGLPEARIHGVTGMADRDPLIKDDPLAAANRRIAITVLRDAPPNPAAH